MHPTVGVYRVRSAVLWMSDVVGSTRLWSAEHAAMNTAMARHHELVHGLIAEHGGTRPPDQGEGDAVFGLFPSGAAAIACAAQVHRALAAEAWPTSLPLMVRIAVHAGDVEERDGNVFGDPVNRCARLRALAAAGQTLVSAALYEVVRDRLPEDLALIDLGEHRLKDLPQPERVWQLSGGGLDGPFPPLAQHGRARHNLPAPTSSFVGREAELTELAALVRGSRLVTVTGFGGMGKTRLALAAAAALADGELGDVWFVDLAAVDEPELVPARVAEVLGVRWGTGSPAEALIAALAERPCVLVLDNLEQVLGCTAFVAQLLERAPGARVLATSREPLRLRGEKQLPIPALSLPRSDVSAASVSSFDAVRLFVDRATSVRPDFVMDQTTAPAVTAVCSRLEGHALALELAAARLRVLSVDELLVRLDSALTVLTGGARDMPQRHQTLRATISWSYDALSADEQLLLARLATLDGPAGLDQVEAVCGEGLEVLDLLTELVDKSLVRRTDVEGQSRFSLLVSIREYAGEQLDTAARRALQDRYAGYILRTVESLGGDLSYRLLHAWVRREIIHVRFALRHLRVTGARDEFARLVAALDDTLLHLGMAGEAMALAESALETPGGTGSALSPDLRARLLGSLLSSRSPYCLPGRELARSCIEAGRASPDPYVQAEALSTALCDAAEDEAHAKALLAELDGAIARLPDATERRLVRHVMAARVLQLVDPTAALESAALLDWMGPVRCGRILLDRGQWREALRVLESARDSDITGEPSPMFARAIHASRASARLQGGQLDEAHRLAKQAQSLEREMGIPPVLSAPVLMGVAWRSGDPAAAVAVADQLLAGLSPEASEHVDVAVVRWRRAVCLRELGRQAEASMELTVARRALAASPLFGPRELLGLLVARAEDLAREDPGRAATVIACVQAYRGSWVLPFQMDARLAGLLRVLPAHDGPVPHPTEAW